MRWDSNQLAPVSNLTSSLPKNSTSTTTTTLDSRERCPRPLSLLLSSLPSKSVD